MAGVDNRSMEAHLEHIRNENIAMKATPYLARYVSPSGNRKVPVQFFALSRKDALRLAKRKAGKGLLFGLRLTTVEPLAPVASTTEKRAA